MGRVCTHLTLPRSPPLLLSESTLSFPSSILSLNRKIKVITAIAIEIEQHPLKKKFDMISYLLLVPEDNF